MNTFNVDNNIQIRPTLRPDLQRVVDAIYLGQLEIKREEQHQIRIGVIALKVVLVGQIHTSPQGQSSGEEIIKDAEVCEQPTIEHKDDGYLHGSGIAKVNKGIMMYSAMSDPDYDAPEGYRIIDNSHGQHGTLGMRIIQCEKCGHIAPPGLSHFCAASLSLEES